MSIIAYQIPLCIPQWIVKTRNNSSGNHAVVKVTSFYTNFLVLLFCPHHLKCKYVIYKLEMCRLMLEVMIKGAHMYAKEKKNICGLRLLVWFALTKLISKWFNVVGHRAVLEKVDTSSLPPAIHGRLQQLKEIIDVKSSSCVLFIAQCMNMKDRHFFPFTNANFFKTARILRLDHHLKTSLKISKLLLQSEILRLQTSSFGFTTGNHVQ